MLHTRVIVHDLIKVVNPILSILDKDDSVLYTAMTDMGRKSNKTAEIWGFEMYKMIQLTDQELELLASMIRYYIGEKQDKPGFQINNAHIMLRHISGINTRKGSNQIAFSGR